MARLQAWEKRLHARYNTDLSTPENRRRAEIYVRWLDHGFLRSFWRNLDQIAPGVWRANHPDRRGFARLKGLGITQVVNLRGESRAAYYHQEVEICRDLGLGLTSLAMSGSAAPPRETLLTLIDIFRRIDRPFVMHCKSGADRTGLASAVYLLEIEGRPLSEARRMLSLRYAHVRRFRSGVLDHILDAYGRRAASAPIGFEAWVRTEYDADALQAEFNRLTGR